MFGMNVLRLKYIYTLKYILKLMYSPCIMLVYDKVRFVFNTFGRSCSSPENCLKWFCDSFVPQSVYTKGHLLILTQGHTKNPEN
jgi:hypothetical protein